jgi:hypothetical protein
MEQILAILLQNFRVAAQLSFAAPCRGACALGTDFFPTGEELRRIRSQRGGQGVDFPDLFFFPEIMFSPGFLAFNGLTYLNVFFGFPF